MSEIDLLRTSVRLLTQEKQRLEVYKQMNQLMQRGLHVMLSLQSPHDMFIRFFELLAEGIFSHKSVHASNSTESSLSSKMLARWVYPFF